MAATSDPLAAERFNADSYIKSELFRGKTKESDLDRLHNLKAHIAQLSDDAKHAVQQNVFINYQQFIDTANEISFLRTEMAALTSLLSEQSELIQSMQASDLGGHTGDRTQFITDEGPSAVEIEKQRRDFLSLAHQVDGLQPLTVRSDRRLLMSCLVHEIVASDGSVVQHKRPAQLVLCSDALIVCTLVRVAEKARRGSVIETPTEKVPQLEHYRYETMYNLDNVAVADITTGSDSAYTTPHCVRLLVFPVQRLFACESSTAKRKVLKAIEQAKRAMLREGGLQRQRTIRSKQSGAIMPSAGGARPVSIVTLDEAGAEFEWLRELPDELDECLAQREFDQVVEMIAEGRQALSELAPSDMHTDLEEKLAQKERALIDTLSAELRSASEKNAQGGPKATRQAIKLLIRLDRSPLACDLYLQQRTSIMKSQIKELRLAEDPLSYHKHLTRIVFGTLTDVAQEFARLFRDNDGCCAVLLLWASGEMRHYAQLLLRHIFEPGPSLAVVGHCVQTLYRNCANLTALGLELTFEVESLILPSVVDAVDAACKSAIDAQRLRNTAANERWRPYNLHTGANLYRFLEEMADLELMLDKYVCEDDETAETPSVPQFAMQYGSVSGDHRCKLYLTHSVCIAARMLVTLAQELPAVRVPHHARLTALCDVALVQLCSQQLDHLRTACKNVEEFRTQAQKITVKCSAQFYINQAIALAEHQYASQIEDGASYTTLSELLQRPENAIIVQMAKDANTAHSHKSPQKAPEYQSVGDV